MTRAELAAGALLLGMVCAVAGYKLGRGDSPQIESMAPAAAVKQTDGSTIIAREPVTKPTPAPHIVPHGATEERRVHVEVKPAKADCPPVRVDLSLVREGAGRRVIASSPDGDIINAIDMPIEAGLVPPPVRRWAAGASYDPVWQLAGVWLERDISRIRIGAEVSQARGGGLQGGVRVGWTW